MLRTRNSIATILVGAVLGGGVTTFAVNSQLAHAGVPVRQLATKADECREARTHLRQARDLLAKADHDEKGRDYQAYKLTQQAIHELNAKLGDQDESKDKDKD